MSARLKYGLIGVGIFVLAQTIEMILRYAP